MTGFKLLVVEDNDGDMDACKSSAEVYNDKNEIKVEIVECKTTDEAFRKLDNSFDGAIIDLKLADQGDEGNEIISKIVGSYFRIPIAIFTGTPNSADDTFSIGVFAKGQIEYRELFDKFRDIYNTGLTRIMGGRGKIEEGMHKIFLNNILPQKEKWVEYGNSDSSRTEKALLRHTIGHLLQLLDEDQERCFPEEVYLHPPLTKNIRTGSIVKEKDSNQRFVVMTPACDLIIRKSGEFKGRILLVEIESHQNIVDSALNEVSKKNKKKERLKKVFGNNHTGYYHWLPEAYLPPENKSFKGGFLNFRKITTWDKDEFAENFDTPPETQISPFFVKDIVARFSSYYARQGQPDIEMDDLIQQLLTQ